MSISTSTTVRGGVFGPALIQRIAADCYKLQKGNTDTLRFPEASYWRRLLNPIRERVLHLVWRAGFLFVSRAPSAPGGLATYLNFVLQNHEQLQAFYELLGDIHSQNLFVELSAFKALGNTHVKLSTNNPEYWKLLDLAKKQLLQRPNTFPIEHFDWCLSYYDLHEVGFPFCLHSNPLGVLDIFLLQQYRYCRGSRLIEATPGDVVIDGGGCFGDTALYFAHKVGPMGKVFCFEFVPRNLQILNTNIGLDKTLNERIKIVPQALWDRSGEIVGYQEDGPASSLRPDLPHSGTVETRAIDDLVKDEGLSRVDFIKMDIEGAELNALYGAENTIRNFRPKLAISLYHKDIDPLTIPFYLAQLESGYRFYLDHFTIHREETVLFASAD